MEDIVKAKLESLRAKTFDELKELPEATSEAFTLRKKRVVITVWIDRLGSDVVRVMIQAYRPYFLGFGMMSAAGFRMTSSGEIRPATESETFDFR